MTRRFSPDLGSSWPFLSLYSVPPQHLLKEATIGGTLAMFCVVERVSGVSYFCSSRRLGSSRRMSWWWELCQRKLSGRTCALPLCGPAGHGQGKTPSGTTLRNGEIPDTMHRAQSSLKQLPIIWRTSVRHLCAPKEFRFSTTHLVVYGSSLSITHPTQRSLALPRTKYHPQSLFTFRRWLKTTFTRFVEVIY